MARLGFTVSSLLAASPAVVWARVSTMAGVNDELWPLFRMTHPPGRERLDATAVPLGERLFRSWILLFGVLPVEYDDLTFAWLEPGRGFGERSPLLTQRVWIHERTLDPVGDGCRLTDRLEFEPRLPVGGRLFQAVFHAVFRHRHRRLRRAFRGR